MLTCIIVPHYDHVPQFEVLLPELLASELPIIIVDDASPDEAFNALQQLLADHNGHTTLIRHSLNQGKGGAVMTGIRAALEAGCTHAVQIDADGQHDVSAISRFRAAAERNPQHIICGQPVFSTDISRLRYFSRFITLWFCWLESLSSEIRDAMCGFRLYPLASVNALINTSNIGKRMAFDPEILVRAIWHDIHLHFIPVDVRYPEGGRSHFLYFRDNVEIFWMHTRLITGMLLRLPSLFARLFKPDKRSGA